MIELQNVRKSYDGGKTFAVSDISFSVKRGELLGLIGESGCGKTTTLKMINRLEEPSSGVILVNGENVRQQNAEQLRRNIGYVFQGIGLFPHYTVAENVSTVPDLLAWPERSGRTLPGRSGSGGLTSAICGQISLSAFRRPAAEGRCCPSSGRSTGTSVDG